MNKRQTKKAFKKKYGCNPPKDEVVSCLGEALQRAVKIIKEWAYKVNGFMTQTVIRIQEMNEDELNRIINTSELTKEQKALILAIRAKKGDTK